jgi:hypothetical protein
MHMNEELPPSERPPRPPSRSWEEEKEAEKAREKEAEKIEEKGYGYAEKFRRDPLSAVFWAAILILVGLVFMAENLDMLPQIGEMEAWHWIAFGAGLLLLLEALVRVVSPDHARPVIGRFIFAVICLMGGLSGLISPEITWPLVLVLIGVGILIRAVLRR